MWVTCGVGWRLGACVGLQGREDMGRVSVWGGVGCVNEGGGCMG